MIHAGLQLLLVVGTVVLADTPARSAGFLGLIDVAVILALTFGVARKSRTCAVLLLLYVAVSIVGSLVLLNLRGVVLRSVFAYFYVQGVRGTFAYHRLVTEQAVLSGDSAEAK